jgi:chromosome segregation ATPase
MDILDEIRQRERADQASRKASWDQLVSATVEGSISPDDAMTLLRESGRSSSDLSSAVSQVVQRRRLLEVAGTLPDLERQYAVINGEEAAARQEFDRVSQAFTHQIKTFEWRRAELSPKVAAAKDAHRQAVATSDNAEILDAKRKSEADLQQTEKLRTEIIRRQQRVDPKSEEGQALAADLKKYTGKIDILHKLIESFDADLAAA